MITPETIIAAREIIGRQFQKVREEKGLSLYAVSQKAGVKREQVISVESGKKDYTIGTFLRICNTLDMCFYMADKQEGQSGHDIDDLAQKGRKLS